MAASWNDDWDDHPWNPIQSINLDPQPGGDEFSLWLMERWKEKGKEMSDTPHGTDADAPDLNGEWEGELDTEEYRDPFGEDGSND